MDGPAQGSDRTRVGEVEEALPGEGEVAVGVECAGVNFLDVMARRGDPGYVPAWPYVPGLEVAGTVRAVGAGVDGFVVGQRVAAFTAGGGGLAEVALARAALTVPVPDGVPLGVSAAAPVMLATAMLLLTGAARLGPGESVLVHSASGGVGGAVAQLVPVLGGGLRVGVVGRPEKVDPAKASGYDVALVRGDDLAREVLAATGGAGVDVVLDPLGTRMLDVDLAVTAPGGRIVLFGNAGGGAPDSLPGMATLIRGNKSIAGFSISSLASTAPARVAHATG
jgi:NADPH2:quinone reductase